MTATDELRRMLDERGVKHKDEYTALDTHGTLYRVTTTADWVYEEPPSCDLLVRSRYDIGAEQAIAATLGRGECSNASKVMDEHGQARFACSECGAWIDSRLLWNPEYRNGESPWVSGCKLNYCPNCGRKVVTNG